MQFLSDDAYNSICSFHSDSAISFAVFLHHLPNMHAQHSPDVLIKAMQVRVQRGVHTSGMIPVVCWWERGDEQGGLLLYM